MPKDPAKARPIFQVAGAEIGSMLIQLTRQHHLLATEMLKEIGLVPPQELVLMRLWEVGSCSHTDMVRAFGRDRSTVTKTLQAMERAGLLDRRPSEVDGRAIVISLTARGKALRPKVLAVWAELERRTVQGLSERQRRTVTEAFDTILANLS